MGNSVWDFLRTNRNDVLTDNYVYYIIKKMSTVFPSDIKG